MIKIRKNIWSLFFILTFIGIIYFSYTQFLKWHDIHNDYKERQTSIVSIVSDASNSLFQTQEMLLQVVGSEVTKTKNNQILDNILNINPSFLAFGFISTEGIPLYVSSNLNPKEMQNLKTNPKTKDSFTYALAKEKMVLGRTYFLPTTQTWVIPVRKTIFNDNGQVKGLMTAGLHIKGSGKLFDKKLYLNDSHEVMLIREHDNYIQFYSGKKESLEDIYNTPVEQKWLDTLFKQLSETHNLTKKDIQNSEQSYALILKTPNGTIQIVVQYDKYFELWIVSTIKDVEIHGEYYKHLMEDSLTFFIFFFIIYALFKYIANIDLKRRKELIFQATHDPLTSLPNRTYLSNHIDEWIHNGAAPFSVFYLDLDRFKNVNDSFGHQFGDYVLIELSKRLKQVVDQSSLIIRQGGDEFIILTRQTDNKILTSIANELIQLTSKPYTIDNLSFVIGLSVGIAKYPEHGTNLDMLLQASDIAMYQAKKHKNSFHHFDPTMQEKYLKNVTIEQALRKALDEKKVFMVYQPQVEKNGKIYGVESLARWVDEDLGFIPPDEFIPVAENSGLMPKLGLYILQTTLQQMDTLQQSLNNTFQVSINISVKQFMEASFLSTFKKEIEKTKLKNENICLEITESLFIEDINYLLPLLEEIHDMGISISMDDFGTGFSSLSMLRNLPIDEVKIDKSFVINMLNDDTVKPMIQNIISIGKNLNLEVLAEGIETEEHAKVLTEFGCDKFQGYYFSKPIPYDKLEVLFKKNL